jgi:hypothetical protein
MIKQELFRKLRLAACLASAVTCASGATVAQMAQAADLIVIGTVQTGFIGGSSISFDMQIDRVLKGPTSLKSVHVQHQWVARLGRPDRPPQPFSVHIYGMLCLKRTVSTDWEVFNLQWPDGAIGSLFWPAVTVLPSSYSVSDSTPLTDRLAFELAAAAEAGRDRPEARPEALFAALGGVSAPARQAVLARFAASSNIAYQSAGIAGLVGTGQPGALDQLSHFWPSITADNRNADMVLSALRDSFRDTTPASVQQLASLIKRTAPSELRNAAVWALAAIHTKDSLSMLADLLTSSDPSEQVRAVFGISSFANGCPPQTSANVQSMGYLQFKNPSPYRTSATIAHFILGGSGPPSAELISFWTAWWVATKAALTAGS